MYCSKCGSENPDDAQLCRSCNSVLASTPTQAPTLGVKTSGLAIAALVLGILSFFTFGITAIPALILGIISLVKIEKSGGRITGRGFAIAGIVVPVLGLLLIGISMPALQRAKKQAQDVVCKNNLRQIGVSGCIYAMENDLFVPRGASGSSQRAWYQLFMPYLPQRPIGDDYRYVEIYRCLRYPDKEQTVCYVVNGWDFKDKDDMVGKEILKLSKLSDCTHPARTIYLVDNEDGPWRHIIRKANDDGNNRCDVWTPGHLPTSDSQDVTNGRRIARARHRKGSNCLFLDWHVEYIAAEDMTLDMWRFEK